MILSYVNYGVAYAASAGAFLLTFAAFIGAIVFGAMAVYTFGKKRGFWEEP